MSERLIRSSGNVFADLGFDPEEAANLVLRSQLMGALLRTLARTKSEAGMVRALGVSRARVADLRAGRIERFQVDELVAWLGRLGTRVELTTRPTRDRGHSGYERGSKRRTSKRLAA